MIERLPSAIPDVVIIRKTRHRDDRGWFEESYRAAWFPDLAFDQDNAALSAARHTIRGLHYQVAPSAQAKLIHVVQGAIRDVAVDLRGGSPTYLHHVTVELNAAEGRSLFIPTGFAHGYLTLEPDTVVAYKVSAPYDPARERGIRWDDPALAIDWGLDGSPVMSERDRSHPPLDPATPPFGDTP